MNGMNKTTKIIGEKIKLKKTNLRELKEVNQIKKAISIKFKEFIFNYKKQKEFTSILTRKQKEAIKKIEEYWTNRITGYNNWKRQKHFSFNKETISTRIGKGLFSSIKNENNNKKIQNCVRFFLQNQSFRHKLINLFYKDIVPGELLRFDITDWMDALIDLYPHVVSSKIRNIEKELITYYFTFHSTFSISYALRIMLVHYTEFNLEDQKPIGKDEVPYILSKILKEEGF